MSHRHTCLPVHLIPNVSLVDVFLHLNALYVITKGGSRGALTPTSAATNRSIIQLYLSACASVQIININSLIVFAKRCDDNPSGACKQHECCNDRTGQTGRTTMTAAALLPSISSASTQKIHLLRENSNRESSRNTQKDLQKSLSVMK